ncbi:MAG: MBOAT family O-acyltransferase, partial [Planctomycetaceae bacterium]
LTPCRSLLDFALYVTFFPQLVAGPIVRASEYLPQLRSSPCVRITNLYPGLIQILRGLIKKVLIADQLAIMVDPVFESPNLFHAATVTLAVLAYAGQIYGDFSGYSDIAVGSARLLGFSLPENFAHPYLATSMSDFWRRWHITLSTWLRDYLYIPLGGNRRGRFRTYLNLMITMILGGLWHGAAWNFVAWGAWHGIALSIERAVWSTNLRAGRGNAHTGGFRISAIRHRAITFVVVLVGWMLFRTTSFSHFGMLAGSLANWNQGLVWLPPIPLAALVLLTLEHAVWASPQRSLLRLAPHRWQTPWLVGFALAALALFAPGKSQPFVYFQF